MSRPRERITNAEARRLALAAQGFAARPDRSTLRHVRGVFDDVAVIQVDSVNVLCRSQELPLWARLGPHARDALPTLVRRSVVFEYWGHEASLMPVELQPLLRWRMAEAKKVAWRSIRNLAKRDPGYIQSVRDEVHARGALAARDLEKRGKRRGETSWWGWDDRKRALAYLFWAGEISAIRTADTFERVYAPFDKVVPAEVLATPTPTPDDARRELLVRAARAHGVGTARDLADYFRIKMPVARPLLAQLVEAGRLAAVAVDGWREPAYLDPDATIPRDVVRGRALLSPFDSLIWCRDRTERVFGFAYRIEIYTPAPERKHGYYVLPFRLDEGIVARVDLKADRAAGALRVHGAYAEPGAPPETAPELAAELVAMAAWLGLDRVVVGRRGNLATALRRLVTAVR